MRQADADENQPPIKTTTPEYDTFAGFDTTASENYIITTASVDFNATPEPFYWTPWQDIDRPGGWGDHEFIPRNAPVSDFDKHTHVTWRFKLL